MYTNFNPILVWFYLTDTSDSRNSQCLISIPFWSDFIIIKYVARIAEKQFQSHSGLILSQHCLQPIHSVHYHFNPILVWFYPSIVLIKDLLKNLISIPFWSDFIYITKLGLECPNWFQSHSGLILSEYTVCLDKNFSKYFNPILVWFYQSKGEVRKVRKDFISIPFWSDFISW